MVTYRWAGATDIGMVKAKNQDAVLPDGAGGGTGPVVVAVADGLGGHPGGNQASRTVIAALSESEMEERSAAQLVEAAQLRLRKHILDAVDEDPAYLTMATTLTLALLQPGGSVEIGHVGDSRAYLGDGTDLVQVTTDHTVAMERVRAGELSEAEAASNPEWHRINNWLGMEPCRAETRRFEVRPGERLLLCSDGVSNLLSHEEVNRLLFSGPVDTSVSSLIAAANQAGGTDNLSVVVVEVMGGPD